MATLAASFSRPLIWPREEYNDNLHLCSSMGEQAMDVGYGTVVNEEIDKI